MVLSWDKTMAGSRVAPAEGPRRSLRSRRNSEHLPNLDIPNDNHKNPFFQSLLHRKQCSPTETREEGKMLMRKFMEEEINREPDIVTPEIKQELDIITPSNCDNPAWSKVGQELRMYADEFMRSKERRKVRDKANQMGKVVCTVTREQFREFLTGLLSGGITRERILVLFFFCADVTIATLRYNEHSGQVCRKLIEWSLQFMVENVCGWVQENGGWGAVFSRSLRYVSKVVVMVAGVGLVAYMGYKRLSK